MQSHSRGDQGRKEGGVACTKRVSGIEGDGFEGDVKDVAFGFQSMKVKSVDVGGNNVVASEFGISDRRSIV